MKCLLGNSKKSILQVAIMQLLICVNLIYGQEIPIAVLDFDGIGISQTEATALSNRLRNELFRLGRFEVVDRGMMENILSEQDFQQTGCTSNDCLVEVGRLLGARQMVGGSVSKVGGTFTVSARLVDVETGKVLSVSDFDLRGELDDMLTSGMAQVAAMLSMGDEEVALPEPIPAPAPTRHAKAYRPHMQLGYGIPDYESGFLLWASWLPNKQFSLGKMSILPALTGGYLEVYYYDDYEEYDASLIYLMPGVNFGYHGRNMGVSGLFNLGYGSGDEYYWEAYFGEDNNSISGLAMQFGAQFSYRIGPIHLLLQADYFWSDGPESLNFNFGIQR